MNLGMMQCFIKRKQVLFYNFPATIPAKGLALGMK
jgi:hypothetical protein